MYFRVLDDAGMPLATANNAKSENEVKRDILSLILPEVMEEDYKDYKKATLRDILIARGWSLDTSEQPHPDYEFDDSFVDRT